VSYWSANPTQAAVSANPTHPVTSIAAALGVDRRHIAAACKRREERDKQPRWIVTMCSRKHGEGRRVPEDALKACVTFWQDLMQQDFMQNLPINNGLALQDHTHQTHTLEDHAQQDHMHEGHLHQVIIVKNMIMPVQKNSFTSLKVLSVLTDRGIVPIHIAS
jgi:hypothetical protein